MTTRLPVAAIAAFAERAFVRVGVPETNALKASRLLVESDLAGQDGHGIFRLPQYIGNILSGRVEPAASIQVVSEAPASALVDGGNGLGHLVMARATELAIEKAKTQGSAWIGVRRSNHAGAASIWASAMLPHDMIGIYMAVGSNNFMAPWGGYERLLGTNPVAIAVPAMDEPPVVVDMATSIAANGKIQMARQRGEMIPEGWVIDRDGKPITDPHKIDQGVLLPAGDYKGYALALMIGLIAGTLNEAAFGREADRKTGPSNTGQAVCAISIDRFGEVGAFKRRIDTISREFRNSGRLPGVESVRLPGERSFETRRERTELGVPLPPSLLSVLDKLASELGIEPLAR
ncbi:MAG: Ldh family oxidoreductase [Hyphomicrobiaceae bacterium]